MRSAMDDSQNQENSKKRHFSIRINLFFFVTFALFSVLIVQLAILQFVRGKELTANEDKTSYKPTPIAPIRGNIYDASGSPIAFTIPVQSVFFRIESNQSKADIIALAQKLEQIFAQYGKKDKPQLKADEIIKLMDVGYDLNQTKTKDPSFFFVPRRIKADLTQQEIAYIMEHRDELKWLEVTEESIRVYNNENVSNTGVKTNIAAQLVGYMRPFARSREAGLDPYTDAAKTAGYLETEDVGYDGLELMYQQDLRGQNGTKTYPVNVLGKIIGPATVVPPEKGHNLYLTIHKDIQLTTQKAILDQIEELHRPKNSIYGYAPNAKSGYAVAMEVKTGRVVAMASMPDYDTNLWTGGIPSDQYTRIQPFVNNGTITTSYPDYPADQLKNHLPSIIYMGSVIKPLSVLVGLNEGYFTTNTPYNDTGAFKFGKKGSEVTIHNSGGEAFGTINAAGAIQHSSNVFMSEMIGNNLYFDKRNVNGASLQLWTSYLNKFGLGVLTGSGLPRETAGSSEYIADAKTQSEQSALIRASWGQNEKYTTLQLAQYAATLANKGKRMKPLFVKEIKTYTNQLVRVVQPEVLDNNTYPDEYWNAIFSGMEKVHIEGFDGVSYTVARKTGTSTQNIRGVPVDNSVFIAFAPAENPTLAVAIVIPEGGFGSYGAAPVARKIFDAYDQYIGLNGTPKGAPAPTPVPSAAKTP
jgi:penicillin-binding protein 2